MALPVCFLTRSAAGASLPSEGMTLDVSPGGLRFDVDLHQPPPLHSEIAACTFVPPHPRVPESSVFLSGRATILRCTPIWSRCGFPGDLAGRITGGRPDAVLPEAGRRASSQEEKKGGNTSVEWSGGLRLPADFSPKRAYYNSPGQRPGKSRVRRVSPIGAY